MQIKYLIINEELDVWFRCKIRYSWFDKTIFLRYRSIRYVGTTEQGGIVEHLISYY